MYTKEKAILRIKRRGPCGKRPLLVAMLRDRITSGQLKPGERLPSVAELQAEFTTTKATALRAIGALVEKGYLRTEERSGVFVVDHPPHVSQFALAFPWPVNHAPSQFYRAIEAEAAKLQDPRHRMSTFYEISRHDGADMQRLSELVVHHRLAGIVFGHDPHMLGNSPILREAGIPRVAIVIAAMPGGLPSVYPDLDGFWSRALERLAARGCRRVAAVINVYSGSPEDQFAYVEKMCTRYGLTTRPEWIQGVPPDKTAWAKSITHLMFRGGAAASPDGLVIADDNFVGPATEGVAAAGVAVPNDLRIVALANFPHPTPSAVPVDRLGFDISRLVAVCMDLISQQRRNKPPAAHTAIPALFEDELPQ